MPLPPITEDKNPNQVHNPISLCESELDANRLAYEKEEKSVNRNMERLITIMLSIAAWMAAAHKKKCKTDELDTNDKQKVVVQKIEDTWNGRAVYWLTWGSAASNFVAVAVGLKTKSDALVNAFSYFGQGLSGVTSLYSNENEGKRTGLNFEQDNLKNKAEGARGGKSESGHRIQELMQKVQDATSSAHQAFQNTASVGG